VFSVLSQRNAFHTQSSSHFSEIRFSILSLFLKKCEGGALRDHTDVCPLAYIRPNSFFFSAVRVASRRLMGPPCCLRPPAKLLVFYAVRVVLRRLMGPPCCLCPPAKLFVIYAVRIVSRKLMGSSSCLCPIIFLLHFYWIRAVSLSRIGPYYCLCFHLIFLILYGLCRVKEAYELTLIFMCPPSLLFAVRVSPNLC
jgi:hypothetical protein